MISRRTGLWVLAVATVLLVVVDLLLPRIPQPQSYHMFANQRSFLGVPNFADVVSNVPFAIVGIWGLIYLLRLNAEEISLRFLDRRELWPYLLIFVGLILTSIGSSYYHLHPDNDRLVWDRVPMTIVFMSLIAALIMERMNLRAGLWLWPLLLLIGVGSVAQWHLSEVHGVGDLRFYGTVQAYSVLFLLLALLFPARYTCGRDWLFVAGCYVLAKILETFDRPIFEMTGQIVSGHTLKHLTAACAGYFILRMLQNRQPIGRAVDLQTSSYQV